MAPTNPRQQSRGVFSSTHCTTYTNQGLSLIRASLCGDASSSNRITALLAATPSYLKQPPTAPAPGPSKPKYPPLNPNSDAILSRPRPVVPGRRHVPFLVNANNFPILRVKKPEPHQLGAYIRKKADKRMRRHERRELLGDDVKLGMAEDQWDFLMRKLEQGTVPGRRTGLSEDADTWAEAPRNAIKTITEQLRVESVKSQQLTRRMEEVIEKEAALGKVEQEQRRAAYRDKVGSGLTDEQRRVLEQEEVSQREDTPLVTAVSAASAG